MRSIWRFAQRVLLLTLVLAVAIGALSYYLASRSKLDLNASYTLKGPLAEIEIIRDARATPHIFGKTAHDVYFGLGFAHAQDRLWQMEFRRRMAQGRLTETAGSFAQLAGVRETLLRMDVTARALDLTGRAKRALEHQRPEILRALEAYAQGVNAWLKIIDEEAKGAGAPELLLAGGAITPWRPEDSIAAFKLLAATLSGSAFAEIRRARYVIAQGPQRTEDLFPQAPGAAVTALPPYASIFEGDPHFAKAAGRSDIAQMWPFGPDIADQLGASNAWAVDGSRSATRAPLLASDPHLPLQAPGIWYMARLDFPDGGVIGATIPGVPAILAGRNKHVAWGVTTLYADVADIFMERLNEEDPNQYLTPEGWKSFARRTERIPLGDGDAIEVVLRDSRHGPILPLGWPQLAEVTPQGYLPALSWTGLKIEDRSLEAVMRLMRVRGADEAMTLAPLVTAPAQTVIIADKSKIALVTVGETPMRKETSVTQGRVPSPGWTGDNDWIGALDAAAMPNSISPASGVVANANNRVVDAPFPNHLGFDWPEPYRMQRLTKLLNNREFHTLNSFRAIQNDTISEMARSVLPFLARDLWRNREDETGLRREALEMLANWNGEMDQFLAEPLIFTAWARAATARLTQDDLSGMGDDYQGLRPLFLERVFRNIDNAGRRWCDDNQTPAEESCAQIASLALDDALAELRAAYGSSISNWRWGRAHEALHRHEPFGRSIFGGLFNITHETGGGDHTLLRGKSTGRGAAPYRNIHAGGFRALYDFADLNRSMYMIATGQSGHFLSPHYSDMAGAWRAGDYAPLSLVRSDAEAGSVGTIVLNPR